MSRTALFLFSLFLFSLFLIFGFAADYATSTQQHPIIALAVASLVGSALAAMVAWDTRKD